MKSDSIQIQDWTKWKKIVSPAVDKKTAFYRWYLYKHGYSRELVHNIIDQMQIKAGQSILDPFCGGGTTLLAASEKGINSVGYDIMPFPTFVSNTKLLRPKISEIEKYERIFTVGNIRKVKGTFKTDIITLKRAFDTKTLNFLFKFRRKIDSIENKDVKKVMLLSFLKNLEKIGRAKKTGGFLRIDPDKKILSSKEIVKNFKITVSEIIEDLKANPLPLSGAAKAFVGDSRNIPNREKFDAIISSPPYPNRHDYTRVYLLEEAFGFLEDNAAIKKLRYKTLRSHVEARKQFEVSNYSQPEDLKKVIKLLSGKKLNNSKITEMLEGFFEDMFLTLQSAKSNLKKGGKVGFVISNARYAGIPVEADKILLELGESAGLKPEGIYMLRNRGNSYQQELKFQRDPARESLVVWNTKN